jgi:riboflavin kinase/FMN adenylyltransferase
LIEAHLIGFRGDLYDEPAKIKFIRRLRGEKRFGGPEDLKNQLKKDVEEASKILSE